MKIKFKYYVDGEFIEQPEPIFSLPVPSGGHSDVGGEQVLKAGFPLPIFPDYKTWKREVFLKHRCGRCWEVVRGHGDLLRHLKLSHMGAPVYLPEAA